MDMQPAIVTVKFICVKACKQFQMLLPKNRSMQVVKQFMRHIAYGIGKRNFRNECNLLTYFTIKRHTIFLVTCWENIITLSTYSIQRFIIRRTSYSQKKL